MADSRAIGRSLNVGDPVRVLCPGLAMLRQFASNGDRPNNHGTIAEIWDDGTILVRFPIGDDDPEEHSQIAPYPAHLVEKRIVREK